MNTQQLAYKIAFGNALNTGKDVKLSKENGQRLIVIKSEKVA